MKFRPCIDIHNGKVKQIVGGSLLDKGDYAQDNFVSEKDGDFYAKLYKDAGLEGGHIILLNPAGSQYYEEDVRQACLALSVYPGGLQIGGGMTAENAAFFLEQGASHIIVTSYVFKDGKINYDNLNRLKETVGKDRIVVDLSCRKKDGHYYIVTDRWQKFTEEFINEKQLDELSKYCDEFLIHGVDAEGKSGGMEKELVEILAKWNKIPITYAGGISSIKQIEEFKRISGGKIDFTIGSALDLFGGKLPYNEIKNIK